MKNSRYRDGVDGGILDDDRLRILMLGLLFLAMLLILLLRLYSLQLHHGEEHQELIAGQSLRKVRIPGVRGAIYSADGVLLAGNRTSYDLLFFPAEMRAGRHSRTVEKMYNTGKLLAEAMGREVFPQKKKISRHLYTSPGVPMTAFSNLTPEEVARALECSRDISGVDIQQSSIRFYPEGKSASAIIGSVRKADSARADDREEFFYYNPDLIGRSGIEKACDYIPGENHIPGLRAYPGQSVIQVTNVGYAHREMLGKKEPIHGNNVHLTIDSRAQKLAEKLLSGYVGAMVVVDADNGDIICSATSPGYDLAKFFPRLEPEYYSKLRNDPAKPLINRAFQAVYPPGSTLKPLIALAMLENGLDPDKKLYCPGEIAIGNATVRCSAHRYFGADMDLETALEKSCNSYMIENAIACGSEPLLQMLKSAGIGRKTAVEINENSGTFPSPELKLKRYRFRWNNFDTALLSIGQGMVGATPLQMALIAGAFANGGTLYQPHLVAEIVDSSGVRLYRRKVFASSRLPVSQVNLERVRRGMFKVVNSSGGSGRKAAVEGLQMYGKTGTAELGSGASKRHITHFIAFVGFENRRYAAAVTVEDGASGGRTCAPLIAAFFDNYFFR